MSYKLEKPCSDKQRADFIVMYNHNLGLNIYETENYIYALDKNEIIDKETSVPILNPNYEEEIFNKRKSDFESQFFKTSLGWIRRKVKMRNNAEKDFLSDLLLQIKTGMDMGMDVEIISYRTPDFNQEIDEEYLKTLQTRVIASRDFITECLQQTVKDFGG